MSLEKLPLAEQVALVVPEVGREEAPAIPYPNLAKVPARGADITGHTQTGYLVEEGHILRQGPAVALARFMEMLSYFHSKEGPEAEVDTVMQVVQET